MNPLSILYLRNDAGDLFSHCRVSTAVMTTGLKEENMAGWGARAATTAQNTPKAECAPDRKRKHSDTASGLPKFLREDPLTQSSTNQYR